MGCFGAYLLFVTTVFILRSYFSILDYLSNMNSSYYVYSMFV